MRGGLREEVDWTAAGETLNRQAQELSVTDFQFTSGPGDAVTVTSSTILSEPDLRYIIYAPFLHFSSTLEDTAKVFTSAIVARLPKGKTIHFEFHKPQDTTLFSILTVHQTQNQHKTGDVSRRTSQHRTTRWQKTPYSRVPCTLVEDRPFYPDI